MSKLRCLLAILVLAMLLGYSPARAAISVIEGDAASEQGNGSLTMTTPSGSASGDVLIAQVTAQSGVTITVPTGWTLISSASTTSTSANLQQKIYYLNLTSTPSSSYSWTVANNSLTTVAGVIYTVRGANAVDCGSAATTNCAGAIQTGGGNQITAPNVQSQPPTYAAGSLRMAFFGTANGALTITPSDSSATQGVSLSTGNNYYWGFFFAGYGVAINGNYFLMSSASNGGQETASINGSANSAGSTLILTASTLSLTCFSDSFSDSSLSSDWATKVVNGSFTPSIVNGRLRMTNTSTNESTAVSLQRLFPGSGNYIQLTFKYYAYKSSSSYSSGADGVAVILSDASVTPQPGGFGGSLGYAPRSSSSLSGFAGGWLGLGLDDYGNFSNKNDSGACAPTVTSCATSAVRQSVSIRGSSPYYYWLKGTGTLSPTVTNYSGQTYRVTVDSQTSGTANVTVERDTSGGTNYSSLLSSFNILSSSGQVAVPSNFTLSLTGSTGDDTNYHEFDDVKVCAKYINSVTTINHYRFAINTTPLTCTPAAVTVTACMDANCTSTYSGDVTATLTATTTNSDDGWVGGSSQTFAGSGATLHLRETTAGTYTIGVSGSTPSLPSFSSSTALCSINGSSYTSANCSAITFADSGLLLTVPTQKAGVTSNSTDGTTFTVAAVKKSDNSLSCTPAFASVSRSVKFWSGYVSPSTGTKTLAVNGTTVGTSSATATSQTLSFDATGTATGQMLNYADAGQISLSAEYDGSASTSDRGLTMTGSSTFVVVPYKLCVDSPDTGWNCTASTTNAQTPANCSVFTTAGSAFNLRVTGKAYSSGVTDVCSMPTTPNYLQSSIPLTSTVYAPSGGSNGSLGTGSIDITSGGSATVSTTESEVGDFTLTATPASGAYFGQTVPSGSNVFGRFIPYGIQITGALTNRGDFSCAADSGFTYLGEPITAKATLSAVNKSGGVTSNYTGSFARLPLNTVSSLSSTGLAFGAQNDTTLLNSRVSASCSNCVAFSSGTTSLTAAVTVARATAVDGPFKAARVGLSVLDADSVGAYSPDYNWDLSGGSEGKLLGTTVLRFGRMRVENAYGSPLLRLNVPAYAQYWNGTSFQKNTDDSCTQLGVPTSSTVTASTVAALYCSGGVGLYGSLAGVTASMNGVAAASTATLASGDAGLWLSKPTNSGGGYLDLAVAVPGYLKYNWDGAALSCSSSVAGDMFDDNPRARIRFGVPRNDKIIYLREVY